MRRTAVRTSLAAFAGLSLLLTGCGTAAGGAQPSAAGERIEVVASTNVYGDIVKAIGGEKVNVRAIITKTSQDPHSYEATAQDRLVISKAALIVENGGGYDGFIHKMADDSNIPHSNIISAVDVSGLATEDDHATVAAGGSADSHSDGHDHNHGAFNEHVWYSMDAMAKVADAVAARLATLDGAAAATFTANSEAFKSGLRELSGKLNGIKAGHDAAPVAVTEPVPVYLLEAAGLANKTPSEYSSAIEEGTDVPPAVLKAATDLAGSAELGFLAYNEQTDGPQTEALKKAAESAGVPVVNFSETLPDGKTYVQWMTDNVENISNALEKNR
ncbi:metal ABC transporter solute-binding protein, Zn/Mn family [Pseudarthrobacter sp. N5]|uniref:metal ABC transporter solute-binding protein, Zn/Mn family n=1 Tax=Pseudarthrobacter sp. N5 TaxID=3418416 RepID=UPI003CF3E953